MDTTIIVKGLDLGLLFINHALERVGDTFFIQLLILALFLGSIFAFVSLVYEIEHYMRVVMRRWF